MGYCCCICRESLSQKRKRGQDVANITIKPVVTTKCGHLFHPECLKKVFSKTGNEVWTTKECPVCKMTLTIATDLIRIFPTGNAFEEEEVGPSVEELQEQIKLYGNKMLEIRHHLEASFLLTRDTQNANKQLQKEVEILSNTKNQLMKSKSEYKSRFEALALENTQLKNTVISLSNTLAQIDGPMQLSKMNINGMPYPPPPGPPMSPFRTYGYPNNNNNMFYQHRWPTPNIPGLMNIAPRPMGQMGRAMSVEGLHVSQERLSRAVSMNQFKPLNNFVSNGQSQTNGTNVTEDDDEHKISNDKGAFRREPEVKQLNFPPPNLPVPTDKEDTEITSSVDEFMDDLFLNGDSSHCKVTKTRYDPMVGQGRVLMTGETRTSGQLYGKFYCENCKAVWGSSRSFPNTPQACRNCDIEVLPFVQCPLQQSNKVPVAFPN